MRALIAAKADVNARAAEAKTALILASSGHGLAPVRASPKIVQALIDAGAQVNARADDGETALVIASAKGFLEVVRILLIAKADVNARTNDGLTPLELASAHGHLGVVRALLAAKADVNSRDNDGDTPLITAAARCLVPDFDGAVFSRESKEALWARFYTQAPGRQRQSVERYSIVKRA